MSMLARLLRHTLMQNLLAAEYVAEELRLAESQILSGAVS